MDIPNNQQKCHHLVFKYIEPKPFIQILFSLPISANQKWAETTPYHLPKWCSNNRPTKMIDFWQFAPKVFYVYICFLASIRWTWTSTQIQGNWICNPSWLHKVVVWLWSPKVKSLDTSNVRIPRFTILLFFCSCKSEVYTISAFWICRNINFLLAFRFCNAQRCIGIPLKGFEVNFCPSIYQILHVKINWLVDYTTPPCGVPERRTKVSVPCCTTPALSHLFCIHQNPLIRTIMPQCF
jgi:hypothetical protein